MDLLIRIVAVPFNIQAAVFEARFYPHLMLILALPLIWTSLLYIIKKMVAEDQPYPVVGKQPGLLLPMWRARFRYIFKGPEMIQEGYQRVAPATPDSRVPDLSDGCSSLVYRCHISGAISKPEPPSCTDKICG